MPSIRDFAAAKAAGRKLVMVTSYDAWSAKLLAKEDVDCLLVGDSVMMAVHGEQDTPVHGFESVTHIRDGPANDDAQRIFQIGFLKFFFDTDVGHIHLNSL